MKNRNLSDQISGAIDKIGVDNFFGLISSIALFTLFMYMAGYELGKDIVHWY